MKTYPDYKPSRLSWLKQIPESWDERRARFLFRVVDERSETGNEELLSVSHITGVTPRSEKNVTMFMAESYEGHKLCQPGDLVINSMWAWMAALGVSRYHGIVSSAYHVYRQHDPRALNTKFLDYLLRTKGYAGEYLWRSKGVWSSRLLLLPFAFFDIPILLPPRKEQDTIVAFLEAKEREIAAFIRDKRRTIELLKEQKAAIINHAVTHGLNRDAPLKPSDSDFYPHVPKHWKVLTLRRLTRKVADGPHFSPDYVDDGFLFLSARNIRPNGWDFSDTKYISEKDFKEFSKRIIPEAGDVLFTKGGTTGVAKVVDLQQPFQVWVHIAVLKLRREIVEPEFLAYALNGSACYAQSQLFTRGATNQDLGLTRMVNIVLGLPPLKEQQEIVCFLDGERKKIADTIAIAEREIALIEEYRASLIDAAVTGKIDVRSVETARPANNVIEFQQVRPAKDSPLQPRKINHIFYRTVLAAEIVHQLHKESTFGRVKLQKIFHLCEYYAEIAEIHGEYERKAAGPYDNKLMYSIEDQLKKHKWYETKDRKPYGHEYVPMENAGSHLTYYKRYWTEEQNQRIHHIISTMRNWLTIDCEIFSTAYAAWNDLIIWGETPTDEAILQEILERWHENKKNVSEIEWRKKLIWMRDEGFEPKGFGSATERKESPTIAL